jgi:hypothetical protein
MTPGQRTQRFGSKSSPPLGASRSCRPSGSEPCPSAPALCSSVVRRRSSRRSDAGPTTETRVSRPRTPQRRFPPTQRHPPSRRSRTDRRGTRPPLLRLTLLHRNRHPDGSCGRSRVIHARGPAWSPQRVPLTEPPGSADVRTLAGGPPAVCRGEPAQARPPPASSADLAFSNLRGGCGGSLAFCRQGRSARPAARTALTPRGPSCSRAALGPTLWLS